MLDNTIMLTGSTGFVGKAVLDSLVKRNYSPVILTRSSKDSPSHSGRFIEYDLSKPGQLSSESFANIDSLIHIAGLAHTKPDSIDDFHNINCRATAILAKQAALNGVKRFVFLSSIGVNGLNSLTPFSEAGPVSPHDPYSQSKLDAEIELFCIAKETGMEVVIIRPPLVYGYGAPGNFQTLVNFIKRRLPMPFGSVDNLRSLVALDNLVDFILLCADRNRSLKAANEIFLISDGKDLSTAELLKRVAKAYGVKPNLFPFPAIIMNFMAKLLGRSDMANRLLGNLQVNSIKAHNLLGWSPVINMEQQLTKMARQDFRRGEE